jgi:hypothetical protein
MLEPGQIAASDSIDDFFNPSLACNVCFSNCNAMLRSNPTKHLFRNGFISHNSKHISLAS